MSPKTILLSALMLLALAGVIAATSSRHWWKAATAAPPVAGQNLPSPASEYGRLRQRFQVTDSAMDISGTIRIYDGETDGLLKEAKLFRSFRHGRQWFNQLSYLQTWCDGDLVLVLDTVHRQIEVSKLVAGGGQGPLAANMSAAMLFGDTAQFRLGGDVEQESGQRILRLRSELNPEIKVCRVYYDTASYRLHRTEIEWWKDRIGRDTSGSNIWLARLDYVYRPRSAQDIGQEMRRYITLGPGGIKPADRYADYHVKVNF
jgi:hypothetical protein